VPSACCYSSSQDAGCDGMGEDEGWVGRGTDGQSEDVNAGDQVSTHQGLMVVAEAQEVHTGTWKHRRGGGDQHVLNCCMIVSADIM
jgi:hypothetical protein